MSAYIYQKATFMLGVANLSQLPDDHGLEVAFAGRSNAGKSSALNAIAGQRSLARTSKTPGRTQQMNYFMLDETRYLVDLPGYGYAKVPVAVKERWQKVIGEYLRTREGIRGLVIVMDSRRPLRPYDRQLLDWCYQANLSTHILLTKADKLSRGAANNVLQQVRKELREICPVKPDAEQASITVQLFSALKKTGVDEVRRQLDEWLSVN